MWKKTPYVYPISASMSQIDQPYKQLFLFSRYFKKKKNLLIPHLVQSVVKN